MEGSQEQSDWWPDAVKRATGIENMQVKHFDRKNKRDISQSLCNSRQLGLHVIDNSDRTPLVICLVAKHTIYTFSPIGDHHAISFLKSELKRDAYEIYTVEGVWDADHLRTYVGIELNNCIDLRAFDVSQDIRDYIKNNPGKTITYSHVVDKIKPKRLEYAQLIEKYLGPQLDLTVSQIELESLKTLPIESNMALNVVKKKSALIRALGLEISSRFNSSLRQPSLTIFSLAYRASDKVREDYERQGDHRFVKLYKTLASCPDRS